MGGDGGEATNGLLLVILILLEFDEGRRVKPGFVVALVDFRSKEIGGSLLFLCLFVVLLLVLII